MKLLLDTHTLIWSAGKEEELSDPARAAIDNSDNLVFLSIISLWEIKIKTGLKKLKVPDDLYSILNEAGYETLNLSVRHIETLGLLPMHHRDPFDRMLVAQAGTEELTLVTRDPALLQYDVKILKA